MKIIAKGETVRCTFRSPRDGIVTCEFKSIDELFGFLRLIYDSSFGTIKS